MNVILQFYFTVNLVLWYVGNLMRIALLPNWENLYMYDYEVDVISRLGKTDKRRAVKFKNAFRLIADKYNLNDSGVFLKSFHGIYLNEFQLKCEPHGVHTTFLDLIITC